MKVLTYNIWDGGINEIGGTRQEKILQVIRETEPDIIALQEARGFHREEFATLEDWEKELGMEGAIGKASSDFHVALLVRPPLKIIQAEAIHPTIFMHACLQAKVGTPGGDLGIFVVHLNPFDPDERLTEARHVARAADADRPVLLLGDCNAFSPRDTIDESVHRLSHRFLARHIAALEPQIGNNPPFDTRAIGMLEWAGFSDVYRTLHPGQAGWTLPTHCPRPRQSAHMRLDFLFATDALMERARSCEVIRTPSSDYGSDHYPLLAEFD